ncbi:MAG TPA: DUF29 family protein [Acetobacteraceae bacterium]|jgi:hypothetical protein|nr:DUF29 family protein [Acetobacteraceae bacterium]
MNSDVLIWSERQAERPAAPHWRGEVVGFLADANSSFSPSMRQGIAAQDLYDRARRQVTAGADGGDPPRPLPDTCPYTLDGLLTENPDPARLAADK